MIEILEHSLLHSIKITLFVIVMMLAVEIINIFTRNKAKAFMRTKKKFQYAFSSFLGALPGCLGSFFSVTLYTHGMISFGAIVGNMIATSGDEAFVMLFYFPKVALLILGLLFVAGIVFGVLTDYIAAKLNIRPCEECKLSVFHEEEQEVGLRHFLKEHLWGHILKKHTVRLFLWIFGTLFFVSLLNQYVDVKQVISNNKAITLLIAALVGIIPESGPNLVFVTLFAQGALPFSILFTNSFVQDGHGMLPMLSYSVRDSLLVKAFNLVFGLAVGYLLLAFGV